MTLLAYPISGFVLQPCTRTAYLALRLAYELNNRARFSADANSSPVQRADFLSNGYMELK
jgi:hypothetical protein